MKLFRASSANFRRNRFWPKSSAFLPRFFRELPPKLVFGQKSSALLPRFFRELPPPPVYHRASYANSARVRDARAARRQCRQCGVLLMFSFFCGMAQMLQQSHAPAHLLRRCVVSGPSPQTVHVASASWPTPTKACTAPASSCKTFWAYLACCCFFRFIACRSPCQGPPANRNGW